MAGLRKVAVLLALLLATASIAEGPRVTRLEPARWDGMLVADMEFENLFPRSIENTLRSGLPVVIDCLVELEGLESRGILLRSELGYDVWEGRYSLRRGNLSRIFEDFAALRGACDRFEAMPIVPISDLPPAASFHIQLRVAVNPFAGEEADRVARWLAETVSDPRDPDSREFRLDLSGLIDGFFRGAEREKGWGESRRFGPFRLDELRWVEVEIQSGMEGP